MKYIVFDKFSGLHGSNRGGVRTNVGGFAQLCTCSPNCEVPFNGMNCLWVFIAGYYASPSHRVGCRKNKRIRSEILMNIALDNSDSHKPGLRLIEC